MDIAAEIDFIYFDLDDTVWDFSANSPVALRHTYDYYGVSDYEPDYSVFRNFYLEKNHELWELYHYGRVEKEFLETERFRYPLVSIGDPRGADGKFCAAMNSEYLQYLATLGATVPGAPELIRKYHAMGKPLGILSNGFAGIQQQKLRSAGLIDYFREIVLSDDVGVTKPLPGIFAHAAQVANCPAHRILMIGDNPDADIAGAHTMGWRTILLNRKGVSPDSTVADEIVDTLTALL